MNVTIKGFNTPPYRVIGEFESVRIDQGSIDDCCVIEYVNGEYVIYISNQKIPIRIVR